MISLTEFSIQMIDFGDVPFDTYAAAFEMFDSNKDGLISITELKPFVKHPDLLL